MINKVLYLVLGVVYLLVYPFKINKNKITFISYNTEKLERDFKLLSDELSKREHYQLNYMLFKYENNLIGKLKYLIHCIVQVYQVNTSALVILDYNNYVVSHFKKKSVTILQVWHASGAIKQFGNDVTREYLIKNYDYILSPSDYWKKPYSRAFGVKEEQVVTLGIPKNDYLFTNKKVESYKNLMIDKFPQIVGKKVVLYAPTFRGVPLKSVTYEKIDLAYIKNQLGDDYVLIYKLHPNLVDVSLSNDTSIINGNNESISKLFSITDYLITDYSSILFDFTILNKPIIAYVPDLEKYNEEVGMYIDYENEIPAPICKTEQEVVKVIKEDQFDLNAIKKFNQKFFYHQDNQATVRITNFIDQVLNFNS